MIKTVFLLMLTMILGCEKSGIPIVGESIQVNTNNEINGVVTALNAVETGNVVDVSANVYNFVDVGAISLTINYDSKNLEYTGITQTSIPLEFYHSLGVIRIGWFGMDGIDLIEGTELFRISFIHRGKSARLSFDDSYTTWCEYATGAPDFTPYCDTPYSIYYINTEIQ
jgi:hypothetical protein